MAEAAVVVVVASLGTGRGRFRESSTSSASEGLSREGLIPEGSRALRCGWRIELGASSGIVLLVAVGADAFGGAPKASEESRHTSAVDEE